MERCAADKVVELLSSYVCYSCDFHYPTTELLPPPLNFLSGIDRSCRCCRCQGGQIEVNRDRGFAKWTIVLLIFSAALTRAGVNKKLIKESGVAKRIVVPPIFS